MISDNNPNRGDRPIRGNFNKIVMAILLLAVIAIILTIIFVGIKGKKMDILHKGEVPQTSVPAVAQSTMPFVTRHIYSETENPTADIAAALKKARAEHKRVLLDFGGDWCGDCQVLDIYFHQKPNANLLAKHFVLVHIYIGHMDRNLDVPNKYDVPINKGVPALAVLDAHGKLLYSQQTGQFENMRNMSSGSVTAFLNQWKA